MNKRMIGSVFEDIAVTYLLKHDFQILERNYRCKIGEIDIVAKKNHILHFIEIKYRKDETYGNAVYSVTKKKQEKIYRIAECYLLEHMIRPNISISFDVLAITGNDVNYIENCYGVM